MPGNITEIELNNFMTFDHLICKPGSRLNLVIGPNGSGKSSLVCAIALALGGEPNVSSCILFPLFFSFAPGAFIELDWGVCIASRQGHKCWSLC